MVPLNRRQFLKVAGAASVSIGTARFIHCGSEKLMKPNIIYINVDDLGWKDVGYMGSEYYKTPNIDRLARKGVTFTNAYAPAANCAPSRACSLTGQYTPHHGIYTVKSSERGESRTRKLIPVANKTVLDDWQKPIAEDLKEVGYITAHVGKWHLGEDPKTQGFDVNTGGSVYGHPESYFSPYRNKYLKDGPEGEYLTDRLTDEAIRFVEAQQNETFFLHLSYYSVHSPLQPKPEKVEKYKRKDKDGLHHNPRYAAMVESVDENVGRLLEKLALLDLEDNTVIVFTSDNGGVWQHTSQKPLRACKGSYYEGGIRVPLIARWLGNIRGGRASDVPVSGIDFYPTFLKLTDAPKSDEKILDGASLMPLLLGNGHIGERPLFWHFPIYLENGNPETRDPVFRTRPGSVIRMGDWKLHEYFEDGSIELYNLNEDIGEMQNLAVKHVDKVQELHRKLVEWRSSIGAPVPSIQNPDYDIEYDRKMRFKT